MQLQLGTGSYNYESITSQKTSTVDLDQEDAKLHEELTKLCPADVWPKGSYAAGCPRPILVSKYHQQQMGYLHAALKIAIIDIVQRWWTDDEACFPDRMPLEEKEEELLKVRNHINLAFDSTTVSLIALNSGCTRRFWRETLATFRNVWDHGDLISWSMWMKIKRRPTESPKLMLGSLSMGSFTKPTVSMLWIKR